MWLVGFWPSPCKRAYCGSKGTKLTYVKPTRFQENKIFGSMRKGGASRSRQYPRPLSLARRLVRSIIHGADMTAETERLDDLVGKALAVDLDDGNARFAKGVLLVGTHYRHDEAVVEFKRAIAVNPSNIGAYSGPQRFRQRRCRRARSKPTSARS